MKLADRFAGHLTAASLAYCAISIALTWPLVLNLAAVVPHDLGDPLLSTWALWWNAHVIPFSERWWNGPIFFPARDTMTFSDHRVGLGLITTPIILAGASSLTAYNVAFLLTFILSAIAAYVLCFTLVKSRAAAFAGGLVFGFHPFRAEHLPHLELLASYWLPIVLLAAHKWVESQRQMWLVCLAAALTMQGLTCGYYFFYFGVLLVLWLAWFIPARLPIRQYVSLALALAAPLAVLAPIIYRYRRAHEAMGLSRSITEIESLSADLIGFLTAPGLLAMWDSPSEWSRQEGALMPGVTAIVIVLLAIVGSGKATSGPLRPAWRLARILCLIGAVMAVTVASIPSIAGPISYELAGLRLSVRSAYKPLSIAALLFGFWLMTSARVRQAWRTRSRLGFYVLATVAMWLFALGPTARLFGERVFYKAPYSWLMLLPGFRDEFRVPARFAMLAALTLSVAFALALVRLVRNKPQTVRVAIVSVVCLGVMLDSWIRPFPLIPPPRPLEIPAAVPSDAALVELPLHTFDDAAAMYRSTFHRHALVNGLSGYGPPHYTILHAALQEGDVEVLTGLAAHRELAVFLSRDPHHASLAPLIRTQANAAFVSDTPMHSVFVIPKSILGGPEVPLSANTANHIAVRELVGESPASLAAIIDNDRRTARLTVDAQSGDEELTVDLGEVFDVSAITLSLGAHAGTYPRALVIELSVDGTQWTEVWQGRIASKALRAAIDDPLEIRMRFGFPRSKSRYIRLRQTGRSRLSPWGIAELRVSGQ